MANESDKSGARVGNVLLTACAGLLLLGVGAAFSVTSRMASMEAIVSISVERLKALESKSEKNGERLSGIETRLERIEEKLPK